MPRLCAFGCKTRGAITHCFPNPKKYPEQFESWVTLAGGKLEKESDYEYYRSRIMCDKHFRDTDKNRNNRLKRFAVPTLFLTEKSDVGNLTINSEQESTSNLLHVRNEATHQATLPSSKTGTNKTTTTGPVSQQVVIHSDHSYSKKKPPSPVEVQPATKDGISRLEIDLEPDDPIETDADAFDTDSLPSPVPEINKTYENIFSWQTSELIEADAPEAPTPVPEKPKLPDDVVMLSLLCDDDAPIQSEPSAPVAAVLEDVNVWCKECAAVIDGFSFWCVQCLCGALCVACAARETHYAHYVLRSPKGATQKQTQAVLAVIRQQLVMDNLLTLYETDGDGMIVEVKREPEEPLSPPEPASPDLLTAELHPDPLTVEVEPHPDPLTMEVEPHPDPLTMEVEPHPDITVKKCADEETDHHTPKRLQIINPTRIPNSTAKTKGSIQRKFLKVPVDVLRRYQKDHTKIIPGVLRKPDIITTSNSTASHQKLDPPKALSGLKVLTPDDLRSLGVKLVTSSKTRGSPVLIAPGSSPRSQVLIATDSNLRSQQSLVPIRGSQTVQITKGDLKLQGSATSNSSMSQDVTNRPMRDPSEMLRTVTLEAAVQLRPLTQADIKKWSADRKRRKND